MLRARVKRRLAAIMVAEVAGYERLMEANDEGTLSSLRRHHQEFIGPAISAFAGRIFKDSGEAFLAEFASAVDAVECAVEIQRVMIGRNAGIPMTGISNSASASIWAMSSSRAKISSVTM